MSVSGTGNFIVGLDEPIIEVTNGVVTVTGDNGGFNKTLMREENGDGEYIRPFFVGDFSGGTGRLTLSGGGDGVNIEVADPAAVGFAGAVQVGAFGSQGDLAMDTGATLISRNSAAYDPALGFAEGSFNNVLIGSDDGNGSVTVAGDGTFLAAYGLGTQIGIGQNGTGVLAITDGGTVGSRRIDAGRGENGDGRIVVDGDGSLLAVNDGYGVDAPFMGTDFSAYGGLLTIGERGGDGVLQVQSGGSVVVNNIEGLTEGAGLRVGDRPGGSGTVNVNGEGSTITVRSDGAPMNTPYASAFINVGKGGVGTINLDNQGQLNALGTNAFMRIGGTHDGTTSSETSSVNLDDGARFTLDSGTSLAADLWLGDGEGASGRLSVKGGSVVTIASDDANPDGFGASIVAGRQGSGIIDVTEGGQILVEGNDDQFPLIFIGDSLTTTQTSGYGALNIDGASSSVIVNGTEPTFGSFIAIGRRNGEGHATITNGGELAATGGFSNIEIGGATGDGGVTSGSGRVVVAGDGSRLATDRVITVGADIVTDGSVVFDASGTGELEVTDGATAAATLIAVGDRGTLSVAGGLIDADLQITGDFFVGGNGRSDDATVNGDFTQISGAVEFEFRAAGSDVLTINGAATLDDDAFIFDFTNPSSTLAEGDEFIFARADSFDVTLDGGFTVTGFGSGTLFEVIEQTDAGQQALSLRVLSLPDEPIPTGGDDRLIGTNAANTIFAGAGDDTIRGLGGDDNLKGQAGRDNIKGGGGNDTVKGNGGNDKLNGGGGDDRVVGGGGNDTVLGRGGDDTLLGRAGDDTLAGNSGNDRLLGNGGNDILKGQGGADVFSFKRNDGRDVIRDFRDGEDLIEIRNGANSLSDLNIRQAGDDVLISFEGTAIKVNNIDRDDFDTDDFLF
ncbi:MAG: hypothetical protein AAF367_15460 [Pseudomonadota bacterium]